MVIIICFFKLGQLASQNLKQGTHDLHSLGVNLVNIVKYPLIPVTLSALILLALIFTEQTFLLFTVGILSYILFWWLLQPVLLIRFEIYLLPLGFIAIARLFDRLRMKKKSPVRWAATGLVSLTLVYSVGLAGYYSVFYMQYHLHRNLVAYHKYTWFYEDYAWLDKHAPKTS